MKPARFAGWVGWVLLAATGAALVSIETLNRAHGDLLTSWRLEYAGGGSGEWRSPEGKQLQQLLVATLWAHIAAPLAALLLLAGAGASEGRRRAIALAGAALALAIFVRLLSLGLLRAAFEIPP